MWHRLLMVPGLGFWCGDKASEKKLKEVEQILDVALPRSLRGFLAEMNGCAVNLAGLEMPDSDRQTIKLVWSCDEIIKQNRRLRSDDETAHERHMAHRDLLWFAQTPNDTLAGFRVMDGKVVESTVFVYNPSHISEPRPEANSLRQYLAALIKEYPREYGKQPWDFL